MVYSLTYNHEYIPPEQRNPTFHVNEVFYSLQGEGYFTGWPAIFIRLSGCNLQCPWCDTDHRFQARLTKEGLFETVDELLEENVTEEARAPLFVITGGEPTLQDWFGLALLLHHRYGNSVCIETNGRICDSPDMQYLRLQGILWVTVSPKIDVENCEPYFEDPEWEGDELKVVLSPKVDQERLKTLPLQLGDRFLRYYIQPCSGDTEPAVQFVKENPIWKLSLQTQKIIGIR